MSEPSDNGANGHDATGRFARGNAGGPGNPFAKQAHQLRAALFAAVTKEDLRDVVRALLGRAKDGDVPAAREVLDRCLGKAEAVDLIERIEALEVLLEEAAPSRSSR